MPNEWNLPNVLVGRDVTAYVVTAGGRDSVSGGFNAGASYDFLGRWKDIKVTRSRNWSEVTASSGTEVERRRTTKDFKASLNGMIRGGGSLAMDLAVGDNDYIQVFFTEENSGRTMQLIGGIDEASWSKQRDDSSDGLEIIGVGFPDPISYV